MPIGKRKLVSTLAQNEPPRVAARGGSCLVILNGKTKPSGLLPFNSHRQAICKERGILCHEITALITSNSY